MTSRSGAHFLFWAPLSFAADFDDLLIWRERVDRAGRGTARSFLSESPPGHLISYNVSMAQVTIYLPDNVEAQAREAAKVRGTSLGRWIAEQVANKVNSEWPPEVLAAIGLFPDFPDEAELRGGYGVDSPREPLD